MDEVEAVSVEVVLGGMVVWWEKELDDATLDKLCKMLVEILGPPESGD